LSQHRRRVDARPVLFREQLGDLEEDRRALDPRGGEPRLACVESGLDRGPYILFARLVAVRQHVPVIVRHHHRHRRAGEDFPAVHDERDLDRTRALPIELGYQLFALGAPWQVAADWFIVRFEDVDNRVVHRRVPSRWFAAPGGARSPQRPSQDVFTNRPRHPAPGR
jgi:hypothetical protein